MSAWPAAARGDKGYDTRDFVATCRTLTVTPHVARNLARAGGSALDARTVRHPGYAISQWIRKRVEEAFGWMKTIGGLRRTRYRGCERVQMHAYLRHRLNIWIVSLDAKRAPVSVSPRDGPVCRAYLFGRRVSGHRVYAGRNLDARIAAVSCR